MNLNYIHSCSKDIRTAVKLLMSRSQKSTLDSIRDHGETEDIAKTGWSQYHNTDQGLFEYHPSRLETSRRMAEAMICFSSAVSVSSQASFLVKNYPWDTITKVVDIGGAQGHISIELT
ncbi:hypothetical protein BOTNAR_0148g00080 [Botryotinia narcissicola]|uniref:O-methyltransferase domain-containing protein n=1 Tax=Botryotinia narcissicola TaxID=278944 RepID=A0A4Z1IM28_9HELO|nr:hypothetical protein BOTNAR_0148g00080 [Botryotinia narcissicola]